MRRQPFAPGVTEIGRQALRGQRSCAGRPLREHALHHACQPMRKWRVGFSGADPGDGPYTIARKPKHGLPIGSDLERLVDEDECELTRIFRMTYAPRQAEKRDEGVGRWGNLRRALHVVAPRMLDSAAPASRSCRRASAL